MKDRLLLVSLLGVLSLGVCVGFAWVDFQRGGTVYVRKAENFRLEPKGDKIGVLEKGTSVIVLEDSRNWVKVRVEGWIWKDSLTDSKVAAYAGDYRAAQIVVSQLSSAEDIIAQLKKGGKFAELAAKHSIGPSAKRGGSCSPAGPQCYAHSWRSLGRTLRSCGARLSTFCAQQSTSMQPRPPMEHHSKSTTSQPLDRSFGDTSKMSGL